MTAEDPQAALAPLAAIAAERQRQIVEEGFDAAHDDAHDPGEFAAAVAAYAFFAACSDAHRASPTTRLSVLNTLWPWDRSSFRPATRRRDLVRAGALIVAKIERMDRAQEHTETETGSRSAT
jgi:hypothetical protein